MVWLYILLYLVIGYLFALYFYCKIDECLEDRITAAILWLLFWQGLILIMLLSIPFQIIERKRSEKDVNDYIRFWQR